MATRGSNRRDRILATRRTPESGESGFTFVELMAVLALISVAMFFVFLNLDGMTAPSRLASAGREIANSVGWIRGEAAAQARDIEVEFDLDSQRYRIVIPPRPGLRRGVPGEDEWDTLPWTLLPAEIRITDVQFTPLDLQYGREHEDTVTRGSRTVTFTRTGASPSFMIHLQSSEILDPTERDFSVEVNGFTGAVTFEAGYKELGAVREEHEMK
jgi:prepilin-type N-terminal cleavage/methylation domain-containing protein